MANTNKQPISLPPVRPQPSSATVAAPTAPIQAPHDTKAPVPVPYNGIPNGNHHTENGCARPSCPFHSTNAPSTLWKNSKNESPAAQSDACSRSGSEVLCSRGTLPLFVLE